jgi:murein DD-endopeptidase MepM/ murein hydrolase activator NlpD
MPIFPLPAFPELNYEQGCGHRYFGAARTKKRKHAGCDLIMARGTKIRAVDDGTVELGPYYFYEGTYALEVRHAAFYVRYGEIQKAKVKAGEKIKKGQVIAEIGCLKMLHFEMYTGKGKGGLTVRNSPPYERRNDLIDPTTQLKSWPLE